MQVIGFIGVGVMGASMAGHLLDGGYQVRVYTRTKSKADALVARGATWCETVRDCVRGCDALITMVGYPRDVEEVYFGENGAIANANPGTILIDMTTTDPALAVRIHAAGAKRGIQTLDAPVSGGDVGAKNGTLSIMAGGDREAFDAAMPLFALMGKTITYTGAAGNGQHTKMCNQIAIAGAVAGVCEAITYARNNGLDVQNMIDCISGGAAGSWQLNNMSPRILRGDYAPGFFIKHLRKDLHLAKKGAEAAHITLPVLDCVSAMYDALEQDGKGDCGTQALIQYYEKTEG